MRVLQYQHNGVGVILSEALNEIGIESTVLATTPHPFGFKEDRLLPWRGGKTRPLELLDWMKYSGCDLLHNHDTVVPRMARLLWRDRLVQHYHAPTVQTKVEGAAATFSSLPGILQQIPEARWMPIPARTRMFRPDLREPGDSVRIGYSAQALDPNKQRMIPCEEIEEAIRLSGGAAVAVPLDAVIDQSEMFKYYRNVDIWVDRLGAGFYGFSSVEAAAMGIPIVTQIGDYERDFVPACPFVSVDRDHVRVALTELIEDGAKREELGRQSRRFALDVHDATHVAEMCRSEYQRILKGD